MGNAMTGLRERLEAKAALHEQMAGKFRPRSMGAQAHADEAALFREAAAALAEGDGAVGYLNISEASEGDGWQDCVTMTAAGRALPVGRHAIYTSPPSASVDASAIMEVVERYAGKTANATKYIRQDLLKLIDSAGGANDCTCPSGDGSLRWPCPSHPPVQPAASVDVEGLRTIIGDGIGGIRAEALTICNVTDGLAQKCSDRIVDRCDKVSKKLQALIDSAGGAKGECCVPDAGEPSFVFLGRDPQAPTLIEQWADERERAEPDSTKPAAARDIARRMRKFKNANPDKGLPASAITPQPAEGDGAVYQWHEFAGRWEDFTKEQFDEVQSSGEIVLGETIITPAMTRKLYTRPAATAVVPEGFVLVPRAAALVAADVADEWAAMFADIPGLEKYDRFQYGPAVEQMHDDMLADAPAAIKGDGAVVADEMVEGVIERVGRENSIDGMDGDAWDRLLVRAALATGGAKGMRDAYEGAREDLLDWKGRAQRAERTLRGIGYTGIDASEAPQPAAPAAPKGRVDAIRERLVECRDWFDQQADVISKGGGSTWDMLQCREQRDLCNAALATGEQP